MSLPLKGVPEEIQLYLTEAYARSQQWSFPNGASWSDTKSIHIRTVGVIGGGTMGRGIAISLCLAGYKVILVENDDKALAFCKKEFELTLKREVHLKRFKQADVDLLRSDVFNFTLDMNELRNCDLIIEAIFEAMALKKELFSKLEKICPTHTIFGTNTSSLDLDQMSSVLSNPSRVVGIHFFNPAHVIKVVEIVRGSHTSPEAVATAFEACQKMQKIAILVGNCPSFVFNRLLAVYLNQAHKLMYQYGLLPKEIDAIITSFGFLMGPITMHDMNGIDVSDKIKREHNIAPNPLEVELMKRKRYGRKSGKGFYKYDSKTQKKENDLEIENIIRELSRSQKPTNIQLICDSDVIDFLLLPMVNEGFLCLEEGMIEDGSLIDLMFLFGFGWPAIGGGGPMYWGKRKGLYKVYEKIRLWHSLEPEERTYKLSASLQKAAKASYNL